MGGPSGHPSPDPVEIPRKGGQRPDTDCRRSRASRGNLRARRRDQRSPARRGRRHSRDCRSTSCWPACRTRRSSTPPSVIAHPLGSRFNGPARGAWYAAFALETAQAEVAFHKSVELAEIGSPDESVTYDEYLADFNAEFHDLRRAPSLSRLSRARTATSPLRRSPRRCSMGIARRRVSERAAQGRHVRRLFPPGARDQRAAEPPLAFQLAGRRPAGDQPRLIAWLVTVVLDNATGGDPCGNCAIPWR